MAKQKFPDIDDLEELDRRLAKGGEGLPNISVKPKTDKAKKKRTSSVALPEYVWGLIKGEVYKSGEPANVVLMRLMKDAGWPIDADDLIDGRKK